MKLYEYITEENLKTEVNNMKKQLNRNMLNTMNKEKVLLSRFVNKPTYNMISKHKTRPNRTPKDTKITYHEWVDKWFYDKFGWKARSEHVCFVDKWKVELSPFSTKTKSFAFPIRPKMVIWSNLVDDLTGEFGLDTSREFEEEEIKELLHVSKYKSGSIADGIRKSGHKHEMMINCKEYYLVDLGVSDMENILTFFDILGMDNILRKLL